jgi:hypothetical protein
MTLSTQPPAGKALNWSLLHTRQWADMKFISLDVTLSPTIETAPEYLAVTTETKYNLPTPGTPHRAIVLLPELVASVSADGMPERSHPAKPLKHAR